MKSYFEKVKTSLRRAFQFIKDMEDALDYRFENYAQDRMNSLERRIQELEKVARTQ